MESRELKQEAEFILGSDALDGIQQWYMESVQQPWDYVVYMVRRSYILALIMEKITGVQMGEKTKFLTDAAFMLQCQELARQFQKRQRFPSVLLCDDVLIHGRSINHFIEELEKNLMACLPGYEEDEIRYALVRALKIHVYVRSDHPLLLLGRYESRLDYARREKPAVWRKLSNDISNLIGRSDIANAAYVYSDWITEEQVQKMDLDAWIHTSYQGTEQYAMVRLLGRPDHVKAVYTMRLIPNRYGGCRLIPFVFLPNLGGKETSDIMEGIQDRMLENNFLDHEIQWFEDWMGQRGKRSFNELVTFIFSSTILREYEQEYDILADKDKSEQEIQKLIRNYRQSDWEDAKDFLRRIILSELFTVEELDQFLLAHISEERQIFSLFPGGNEKLGEDEQWEIVDALEDYFYEQGRAEEIEAYKLSILPYSENARRSKRTARGCCFLLNEAASYYEVGQAKYAVAYFLQMMDAGVLSLSSYAPSNVKVVGFAQFAKAGEQSLALEVLKKYEYLPLLLKIQEYCEYQGEDILDELDDYAVSGQCDLSQAVIEDLRIFVQELRKMGQMPDDWSGNFLFKIDNQYHIKRAGYQDIIDYKKRQYRHVKKYINYLYGDV